MHKMRFISPTLISGVPILALALIAPALVRNDMIMVCQKDRKMTSLIASTFWKGLC